MTIIGRNGERFEQLETIYAGLESLSKESHVARDVFYEFHTALKEYKGESLLSFVDDSFISGFQDAASWGEIMINNLIEYIGRELTPYEVGFKGYILAKRYNDYSRANDCFDFAEQNLFSYNELYYLGRVFILSEDMDRKKRVLQKALDASTTIKEYSEICAYVCHSNHLNDKIWARELLNKYLDSNNFIDYSYFIFLVADRSCLDDQELTREFVQKTKIQCHSFEDYLKLFRLIKDYTMSTAHGVVLDIFLELIDLLENDKQKEELLDELESIENLNYNFNDFINAFENKSIEELKFMFSKKGSGVNYEFTIDDVSDFLLKTASDIPKSREVIKDDFLKKINTGEVLAWDYVSMANSLDFYYTFNNHPFVSKFLLNKAEEMAETFDDFQYVASTIIELKNLDDWEYRGRNLYTKALEKVSSLDELISLARDISKFNIKWACELYDMAIESYVSIKDSLEIATSLIPEKWGEQKGKEIFEKAKQKVNTIKDYYELIDFSANTWEMKNTDSAKILLKEVFEKFEDFNDLIILKTAFSRNKELLKEFVIKCICRLENNEEKNELQEVYDLSEDIEEDLKNLSIDNLKLKYCNKQG